jgi:hypothetical protein
MAFGDACFTTSYMLCFIALDGVPGQLSLSLVSQALTTHIFYMFVLAAGSSAAGWGQG